MLVQRNCSNVQYKRSAIIAELNELQRLIKYPIPSWPYTPMVQLPLYLGDDWRAVEFRRIDWLTLPGVVRGIIRHRLAQYDGVTTAAMRCTKHKKRCECEQAVYRIEGLTRALAHSIRDLSLQNSVKPTIKRKKVTI